MAISASGCNVIDVRPVDETRAAVCRCSRARIQVERTERIQRHITASMSARPSEGERWNFSRPRNFSI